MAALGEFRVVAGRQIADEGVRVHHARRPKRPFATDFRIVERDVLQHRAGEDVEVLQHHADAPPQLLAGDLVHVHAVHEHHAVAEVVEARQQADDGALAGAGGADDRQLAARRDVERDVLEHQVVLAGRCRIGEGHATELDLAAQPLRQREGLFRFVQPFVPVEGLEDALAGGHRTEQQVEEAAHGLDRIHHHVDVLREGEHHAEADGLLHHLPAAEPQHAHGGDRGEAHVEGLEHHLVVDGAELLAAVVAVQRAVLLLVHRLAPGDLHHLDADQVFLHVLVERRDGIADEPEDAPHGAPEVEGRHRRHGNHGQPDRRQVDAQGEHDGRRGEELDEHSGASDEADEQVEEILDVVGDAGHHAPHRHMVVERRRLAFQGREQVDAQVAQRLQGAAGEQKLLRQAEDHLHREHAGVDDQRASQQRPLHREPGVDPPGRPIQQFRQVEARHVARRGIRHQHLVHHHAVVEHRHQRRETHADDDQHGAGDQGDAVGLGPLEHAQEQPQIERLMRQLGVEGRVVARRRGALHGVAHQSPWAAASGSASASRSCSRALRRVRSRS